MAIHQTINQTERVVIEYKVTKGNVSKQIEIPFKVLSIGDYTNRKDDKSIDEREKVKINKRNFDEALKEFKITIDTMVKSKLSTIDSEEFRVEIPIKGIKSFEPDSLVEEIPEMKERYEARKAVLALKGPLANDPEFKEKVNNMLKNSGNSE